MAFPFHCSPDPNIASREAGRRVMCGDHPAAGECRARP
jgi:hypothetical protein